MTPREYLRYTEALKAAGYEYRKDCPYKRRNLWIKYPKEDRGSYIRMDVYHGFNAEGIEYYTVNPHGIINRGDCECSLNLDIAFNTTNIVDIESMFEKYYEKLEDKKNDFAYVVTRCEEHDDYVEKVFVNESKAVEYCKKFNDKPNEYSRSITKIELTL